MKIGTLCKAQAWNIIPNSRVETKTVETKTENLNMSIPGRECQQRAKVIPYFLRMETLKNRSYKAVHTVIPI